MKITIITLFPKMISGFIDESIVKRAQSKGLVEINIVNLREFALDNYGSVDDHPYGGGAGMVLCVEPIYNALKSVNSLAHAGGLSNLQGSSKQKILLTTPKGRKYSQSITKEYSLLDEIVIIAGHYEEVDERVRDFIDEEVSLGDFVMTGGEITAAAIVDSIVRLIPGVLKKSDATQFESFFEVDLKKLLKLFPSDIHLINLLKKGVENVKLLEYPQYTRPENFKGNKVPKVLLSGNHKEISEWQIIQSYEETLKKRSDLLS